MREMKFRAWIDGAYLVYSDMSKTYPYDEDEILWGIQGGLEVSTYETLHRISGGDVDEYESFTLRGGEGDEVVFMQYTGLKDKNGVEAFEGDICINEKGRIAKIIWFESGACFDFIALNELGDNYGYSAQMFKYKIEIIGNMHENPELLETNND